MDRSAHEILEEERRTAGARFVITPEAAFFVPGLIQRAVPGRRRAVRVTSLRGVYRGRPIVTIPPEEAG